MDNPDQFAQHRKIYSNTSKLLGMEILTADTDNGIIEASFVAGDMFQNFTDHVHGGILVSMLDDLMGYALGITLEPNVYAHTANMNVSFLRPAELGRLHGKGQVLKKTGDVYFLAAKLYNAANELVSAGTSQAKVVRYSI